jgi:hypothetical protein
MVFYYKNILGECIQYTPSEQTIEAIVSGVEKGIKVAESLFKAKETAGQTIEKALEMSLAINSDIVVIWERRILAVARQGLLLSDDPSEAVSRPIGMRI